MYKMSIANKRIINNIAIFKLFCQTFAVNTFHVFCKVSGITACDTPTVDKFIS